jgi:zinc protease
MRALILFTALFASCIVRAAEPVEGLPEPAEPRPAKFLTPQEKTLANGLRVIVVERPGIPLVSAEVLLQSGSEADLPTASGLAEFTAALLTQGTATRSATQIAREVEALGASLKATATWDASQVELTTLSAQLEPAFALLADVTRHPRFATSEIERLRRLTLDELRLSFEEPGTIAKLAASRLIYGRGPYAHPEKGTVASLQHITHKDIADFHTAHYTAKQAQLIIAGNVTAEVAFALAEKNFGDWKVEPEKTAPAAAEPKPKAKKKSAEAAKNSTAASAASDAPPKPRAVLIDMPNAGQAAVVVGGPGIVRKADDYFAGTLANTVLGGGYTSFLNEEIRVKRGLSYGASSVLSTHRTSGKITARCQTKNVSAPEVVTLMRGELKRLGSELVPADFVATRQAMLGGDFARELETNHGYLDQLADLAMHDLPLDQLPQYLDHIDEITPEAIRAFAEKHFVPGAMSVVVAGKAKEIGKALHDLLPTLEVIPQAELDLDSPTLRRAAKH